MRLLAVLFLLFLLSQPICPHDIADDDDDSEDTKVQVEPVKVLGESPAGQSEEIPAAKAVVVEAVPSYKKYWVELTVCIAGCFVVLQIFTGKNTNSAIAGKWLEATKDLFESQFHSIGFDDSYVIARGWNAFGFYASGRQNIKYILIKLEMAPRQCPWLYYFGSLVVPQRDHMIIEMALDAMEIFSLAIGRRLEVKSLQKVNDDFAAVTLVRKCAALPNQLAVVADANEPVNKLLTPEISRLLAKHEKYVKSIVIATNLLALERDPSQRKVVRADILLPSRGNLQESEEVLRMLLMIADQSVSLKLSEKAKQEVKKSRHPLNERAMEAIREQQEEMSIAKRAEKRKEEEERFARMTPDQQRKYEEKQRQKQMKSRMKVKMVR